MAFCDFVVKYDPNKDTPEELTERIIYSIFVKRLKSKKPCIIFLCGDSGEGKSYTGLTLSNIMLKTQGVKYKDYINETNVYTPIEYPKKIQALLHDKRLKKVNVITVHEARELIRAKDWHSFLSQSIADINAMSRKIKRLAIIIISQFIRDITTDVRYTLNFYVKVSRPKGKPARAKIFVMWKDDRDLEKPKLRKRKLSGYLVNPQGKYRRYVPKYLELRLPPKEITEVFDKGDYDAKAGIIKKKLNDLIKDMEKDFTDKDTKLTGLVSWYSERTELINQIGKIYKGKFRIKKEFREVNEFSKEEAQRFEEMLKEALEKKGVIEK